MADELEIGDSRIEFMALYLLKTLKLKNDKWMKMYAIEENKIVIQEFLDKPDLNILVFSLNAAQALIVSYSYPTQIKSKACYFAKKNKDAITKDASIKDVLIYGDLSYSPLDQLSAILDEVISQNQLKLKFYFSKRKHIFLKLLIPVFSNSQNQNNWPKVISDDLLRHINNLKNKTFVISGQMKGKTQLPIPAGADKVADFDLQMAEKFVLHLT
jgi:dynein heavy chain